MILESILVILTIFMAFTFFYKQAICEFRINQIEWSQNPQLSDLFRERVPIVIRGRPSTAFWTQEDILIRDNYSFVKIFEDQTLSDWIMSITPNTQCPWGHDHARLLANKNISGLSLWVEKIINPIVYQNNYIKKAWLTPYGGCWAGEKGLWKTKAIWTILFVTQGTASITLLTENIESSLPPLWNDKFPSRMTTYDTPFLSDLKFIDIILRPGNMIFVPTHWLISWTHFNEGENSVCPMVCTIEYHSPVSLFSEKIQKST